MSAIRPATAPRSAKAHRVLVVDGGSGAMHVASSLELASLFEPGDLLIVNDAATLPASLRAKTARGEDVELRLATSTGDRTWTVVLFGRGDWRTPTERRPPPPALGLGDRLTIDRGLVASIVSVSPRSPRIVDVELTIDAEDHGLAQIWAALYRAGRPVQYAYVSEPLALWDVQNVYAGRPWAVEMPSAGRIVRVDTIQKLRRRGIEIARVTHAAGLSSIGDVALDALLPLPERFEVPDETWEAIARSRKRGGRVVTVGTSAARALEGGARAGKRSGVTDFRIDPSTRRAIVDAVLTGVHDAGTSHYALLGAFAGPEILAKALARAESEGLLDHELGDACLVWGAPRAAVVRERDGVSSCLPFS